MGNGSASHTEPLKTGEEKGDLCCLLTSVRFVRFPWEVVHEKEYSYLRGDPYSGK